MKAPFLDSFQYQGSKHTYDVGGLLFLEGEMSEAVWMLVQGVARGYCGDPHSGLLHFFFAPTLIGEVSCLEGTPYPLSIQAETEIEVIRIPKERFLASLSGEDGWLIASLIEKVRSLQNARRFSSAQNSRLRLARFLLACDGIPESMRHKDIAALLSITPETLSRTLKVFEVQGLIKREGRRVYSVNQAALTALIDHF